MPLITQKDIDDIKVAIAELAEFTEEPIIYRTYIGMTEGNPILGNSNTPNYIDTEETAMVRELTVEEVAVSGGVYVLGDTEFSIRRATEPKYEDRILYVGSTWKPKRINPFYLGEVLWWEVRARKE